MARKPRLHVSGGLYHVILRGNARQDIFFSLTDREVFYALLAEGVVRFGYRVHAFCLMTNHVHLALQAGDLALSRGLQNLSFRYTRHINWRLKRSGHLFQGRYKAFLVDQDRYGQQLVRYIHLNPVRAGLVADPAAYAFSSHRCYIGSQELAWLTTDWVLGQFAHQRAAAQRRFGAFVSQGIGEGHRDEFYGGQADSRIVGEEDFAARFQSASPASVRAPSLERIVDQVCSVHGVSSQWLLAPGKARAPSKLRALIVWLAQHTGAATLETVARRFGRDATTLSHAVRALDAQAGQSQALSALLSKHLDEVLK